VERVRKERKKLEKERGQKEEWRDFIHKHTNIYG
jgi:hypothetical protein